MIEAFLRFNYVANKIHNAIELPRWSIVRSLSSFFRKQTPGNAINETENETRIASTWNDLFGITLIDRSSNSSHVCRNMDFYVVFLKRNTNDRLAEKGYESYDLSFDRPRFDRRRSSSFLPSTRNERYFVRFFFSPLAWEGEFFSELFRQFDLTLFNRAGWSRRNCIIEWE